MASGPVKNLAREEKIMIANKFRNSRDMIDIALNSPADPHTIYKVRNWPLLS